VTAPAPRLDVGPPPAEPHPGLTAAPAPTADATLRDLVRASALLGSLGDAAVSDGLRAGHLRAREVWRDEIVADSAAAEASGDWIYVVEAGQIVAGLFDPDVLDDERSWNRESGADGRRRKIRPQGPLIHLAERHLAVFGPGELFNSRALAGASGHCAFFAPQPSRLLAARPDWLGEAADGNPALAGALARAVAATRARLAGLSGVRAELLDFHVRQGLSVAGRLRLVQIDRCIECRQCERACAERHGVARLVIPGPRLDRIGIAVTCRTCVDRRCLDVCNFDSIEFDAAAAEVRINESSCTGCAGCATACPYGAIQMIRLDDPARADYRARLEARGALRAGPDADRREPIEQIASKCDHCAGYADQACISHCPTGALIEVSPAALLGLDPTAPQAAAQGARVAPLRDPRAGQEELGVLPADDSVEARLHVAGPRWRLRLLWGLGLLGLLLAGVEIALRGLAPSSSVQYQLLLATGLEPALARFNVRYLAGSPLSLALGYAGSALILLALVHPLRKRWPWLRRVGRGSAWFDLHVVGGTLGPLYIVLHSAFHLYNWVAIAVWAFAAVVASGLVGRHALTRLTDRFPGASAVSAAVDAELVRTGAAWPEALAAARIEIAQHRRAARSAGSGLAAALAWLAGSLRRPLVDARRRVALARAGVPWRARGRLSRCVARAIAAHRRAALAARCALSLRGWLPIHVLLTALAVSVAVAHVIAALRYSM
jgi:Fe-S-cluster-containing hydrogenase component 2